MPPPNDRFLPTDYDNDVPAVEIHVCGYNPGEGLFRLPSLECLSITRHAGAKPATARFRYRFGDDNPNSPQNVEQAVSASSGEERSYPHQIVPGDRIAVFARPADADPSDGSYGSWEPLFEGSVFGYEARHAGTPSGGVEDAPLLALATPFRLFDTPIAGAILRDSTRLRTGDDGSGNPPDDTDTRTRLPGTFNDQKRPNATLDDSDADSKPKGEFSRRYPVFVPDGIARRYSYNPPDPHFNVSSFWTLNRAVAYLIHAHWPLLDTDLAQDFDFPDRDELDAILVSRVPKANVTFNPDDPDTYDAEPIPTPNVPIKGRSWIELAESMVADKGFGMWWTLEYSAASERFRHVLNLRYLQAGAPIDLRLQARGDALDVDLSYLSALDFTRDVSHAANVVEVSGGPALVEASFILAPAYPADAADASDGTIEDFNRNSPEFDKLASDGTPNRDKYRLYHFGEIGERCFAAGTSTTLTVDPDALAAVLKFTPDDAFVRRPRPPKGELVTRGADGKRLKAQLFYSTAYSGPVPAVWDGSSPTDWRRIAGGFDLRPDRLGISIDVETATKWIIGSDDGHDGITLNPVEDQLGLTATGKWTLMLVCAVETDEPAGAVASRSRKAVLPYDVTRWVDARDRFSKEVVKARSWMNTDPPLTDASPGAPGSGTDDLVAKDDTADAASEAYALRDATDYGVLEGTVTVPRFTAVYQLLDRARGITGRGISLRTDGLETGESPIYPLITSVTWSFDGEQATHYTMSDANARRTSYRAHRRPPLRL